MARSGERGRRPEHRRKRKSVKIEFVSYDDQSEPAKAAQIYEKLIANDKVDLLLAPWGTATHIAVAPVVERHKFPLVGATASTTLVGDLGAKYMWFAEIMPDDFGSDLPKLLTEVGAKRVAIITNQLPLALETKKFLLPALQKGRARSSIQSGVSGRTLRT